MPRDSSPPTLPTGSIPPPDFPIADTGTADDVYRDVAPVDAYPPDPYRGRVVALDRTPLTDVELYTLARVGYLLAFGVNASYEAGLIAWAHLCLEHDRGHAVWSNNLGNQAATHEWTGPVAPLTADDVIDGHRGPHTQMLRAYPSPEQGAAGYWLRLREGYPTALATFDSGDGDRAARALKAARYYTEDVEVVAHGMRLLVAEGRRRFEVGVP